MATAATTLVRPVSPDDLGVDMDVVGMYAAGHDQRMIRSDTGLSEDRIRKALNRHGIVRVRTRGGTAKVRYPQLRDPAFMVHHLCVEKLSAEALSRVVGCTARLAREATWFECNTGPLEAGDYDVQGNAALAQHFGGALLPGRATAPDALQVLPYDGSWVTVDQVQAALGDWGPFDRKAVRRRLETLVRVEAVERRRRREADGSLTVLYRTVGKLEGDVDVAAAVTHTPQYFDVDARGHDGASLARLRCELAAEHGLLLSQVWVRLHRSARLLEDADALRREARDLHAGLRAVSCPIESLVAVTDLMAEASELEVRAAAYERAEGA